MASTQDIKQPAPGEQTRRQHEARYRTLIELSPQAVWSARPDGYITYCNQWWLDYTGLTMEELEGNGWTQAVHPDYRQRIIDIWLQAAASGGDHEAEIPVRRTSDGMYRWHLAKISPIKNGESQVTEWMGIAVDIHDRKQAEQVASESEVWLRLVLDSMPQKIFTATPKGEVDYFNPQWSEFTGLPFETIRDWGWTQFVHPDDIEMNVERWQNSIDTGEPFLFEHRFLHADGAYRWHVSRARPVRDKTDRIVMWVGANTDVDDQKRAEALQAGHKRVLEMMNLDVPLAEILQALVELVEKQSRSGLLGSFLLLDDDGVHLRHGAAPSLPEAYNRAIDGIATGPEAGSCGTAVFLKKPVHASDIATDPLWANFRELALTHDLRACFSTPVFSSHGEVLGTFTMYYRQARDADEEDLSLAEVVTRTASVAIERGRWQEEAKRLNETLEQRVIERTAQLEAANQEIEAFSYSVSHDLRAPLRAIDGFSRSLLHDYADKLDARGQSDLARVRAAAQRMGQLIDDLLALSRLTRSEMRPMPVDLSDLAHAAAADLEAAEPERQVQLVVTPGMEAVADADLMRVVLDNLLGNAWKFTSKQPGARIEVGAEPYESGTVFYVRDNGCGFNMAYADKLFGAFQRLHSRAEFDGTGIGLATTQRIIHRHGGRIWAQAAVGEGATFSFTLSPTDGAPSP